MLQLKDVCKSYTTANFTQVALNHVSLAFRDNEFVAILGPSGSGKTTMLNIIGGLDHYDSGDLLIDGISTKQYRDRDWDTYRNNRIGFVFQAYNLIPHQTILENVELALTLSGVSRAERRERACAALERVGLREHINKKPSQLSGGQMQRVAIARALVNEPEIILADEPTGALDSKTSVQIMDLLTEIAGDRLVIMVTHNPELAEQYATRIVNLAVPSTQAVAGFLTSTTNVEPKVAQRAARLAEGHIGIAKLYATDERVMSDRDELVVGVLNLARASDAVLLAGNLIDNAKAQAEADANRITAGQEAEFRRINGLAPSDRIPPKLRGAFNQIAKKDDVKRLVTRRTRDVLDRALNSIASIYRDVAVLQNNAEDSVGLINLENRSSITELSVRLNRAGAVTRLDEVAHARKRLAGNGNPLLVFESLFCALIS